MYAVIETGGIEPVIAVSTYKQSVVEAEKIGRLRADRQLCCGATGVRQCHVCVSLLLKPVAVLRSIRQIVAAVKLFATIAGSNRVIAIAAENDLA